MSKQFNFLTPVFFLLLWLFTSASFASEFGFTDKGQAKAPKTQPFGEDAFRQPTHTEIRWLGMAGFLVNSRGVTFMIDPLLEGFDMPLLFDFPIGADKVPHLDAVLITHSDNDHFSLATLRELAHVTDVFHSTHYVHSLMQQESLNSKGHGIGAKFSVKSVDVRLTPADHSWQNALPGESERVFKDEDSAGFWIGTPDGSIWATGDSRLMPEHLNLPKAPDVILFDFSDSEWHFTLGGAIRLANAYPEASLLLHHWGSVDAPEFAPFNANPEVLYDRVTNPERIKVLAPGEKFVLKESHVVHNAK